MGRKPTVNKHLPPHMRARVRSGKTYYFFDMGGRPRKEASLGTDYIEALRRYVELAGDETPVHEATFDDLSKKYKLEAIPNKAESTRRVQNSDIKHLDKFFAEAPLGEIRPMHMQQFLQLHKATPTTANRCKRLFSSMWNNARAWGYTDMPNPCTGIAGFTLGKRETYTTDAVFKAVWECGSEPLRDAMDLTYLTGQRPGDALKSTEHEISDNYLEIQQGKTKQKLRIAIVGELAALIERIKERKRKYKVVHTALLVNMQGMQLTKAVLRKHFDKAREMACEKYPELEADIKAFWFYDLRAKAADDKAEEIDEQAASDLLGHESTKTTRRHYLRRGKKVMPTK